MGRRPGDGRRLALIVFVLMFIPVISAALVFPALSSQPFDSVSEIDPGQIKWLSVRILNRTELDGGPDIGPYFADPADFPALLEPLKAVPRVESIDGAQGPWLGEYRVMLQNGRRGTIRLYWHRNPARPGEPVILRFKIASNLHEGGVAADVISAATRCESRGRSSP